MSFDSGHRPSAFKAAVALACLADKDSIEQIAARFGVTPGDAARWMEELTVGAARVFEESGSAKTQTPLMTRSELAITIAENSTQGFAMMDGRGYCIYANRAWLQMTGYTAEEIGSQPLHYLVHHHHPDGRPYPMSECPIDRALPENFEVRAHEDLFFRKDGSTFFVMCAASPIFEAGKPIATVIEIRDITERRLLDQRLIESEQRAREAAAEAERERAALDALLEAVPVGIVMTDVDGKFIKTNPAMHRIWGGAAPMSRSIDEYGEWQGRWADGSDRHGQALGKEDWPLFKVLQGHEESHAIIDIASADAPAERRSIVISAAPVKDARGQVIGGVAAQLDISERVKAEQELKEADRRKNEFIAMLAHELRNPLAPIAAAAQLLELAADDPGRSRRASDIIARQVRHMTELVDDLLDVSRVTRGLVELDKQDLDLKAVVAGAVEQARPMIEARRHALTTRIDAEDVMVHGDRTRLVQVMANLLSNSAKYTAQGGDIRLRVEVEGAQARIEVRDNGMGIDAGLLPHVFDLFTQAERTPDRSQGGLGIGLALVKTVVALHGGTVKAHSDGPGAGSTFTVTLPLAGKGRPQEEAKAQPAPEATSSLAIMVVDDNLDAAHTLAALLELHGHRLTVADNATAALLQAERQHHAVYILDIGLPDMTGYELARRLRERRPSPAATFIALSGYGQAHDRVLSKAAGFDHHFVKPVDMAQLASVLGEAG